MQKYQWIKEIGHGSFSYVYLAQNTDNDSYVAIKAMKHKLAGEEQISQLRQIQALKKLNHPNIIKLKQSIVQNNKLYLVFQYMDNNIYDYYLNNPVYHGCKKYQQTCIKNQQKNVNKSRQKQGRQRSTRQKQNEDQIIDSLSEQTIKAILLQIVSGLAEIHQKNILHRDLKPQNILIRYPNGSNTQQSNGLEVKIADFGLARDQSSPNSDLTNYISTRWYRAPQLVIKMKKYSQAVDIFALGCIMAQLYNNIPLFPGSNIVQHLQLQMNQLGSPGDLEWPQFYGWCIKKGYNVPKTFKNTGNIIKRQKIDPNAEKLLREMLNFVPHKRITAEKQGFLIQTES